MFEGDIEGLITDSRSCYRICYTNRRCYTDISYFYNRKLIN